MGGKASRMKDFANLIYKVLGKPKNCEFEASDNDGKSFFYSTSTI